MYSNRLKKWEFWKNMMNFKMAGIHGKKENNTKEPRDMSLYNQEGKDTDVDV